MNPIALVLQAALGCAVLTLGLGKLIGHPRLRAAFVRLRLPAWLRLALGAVETVLGAALLISVVQPILAFPAAALVALISTGAVGIHLLRGRQGGWPVPATLLLAALGVAGLQPLGLRIMALPVAKSLPLAAAPEFKVLTAFPPGVWLESLVVAPDGAIFLTANQGLDLMTGDRANAMGKVVRRAPDGSLTTVLALPERSVAGALALDQAGALYLTSLGDVPGVWRIADGQAARLADLPPDAWPNGLSIGPDGQLYVADSRLGRIWRVDPTSGAVSIAVEDDLLRPRPFVALAPGANGVGFRGDEMIVTVSDRAMVLGFRIAGDGSFALPVVLATGIPGDGLAIDAAGTLHVTTHPYDSVVRIAEDGTETLVATGEQGISGASDAAFGTGATDTGTLYVTTDGGAFGGKRDAAGLLVALRLR